MSVKSNEMSKREADSQKKKKRKQGSDEKERVMLQIKQKSRPNQFITDQWIPPTRPCVCHLLFLIPPAP